MSELVVGACLCGAVRLEASLPARWCANCHCGMCRRAHGAPWVTWASFDEDKLRILAGADRLRTRASSADAERSFCGDCGSPLLFRSARWSGEVHVARACLDDGAALSPAVHAFFSDRAPWHPVGDALPRRGGPTGTEPL